MKKLAILTYLAISTAALAHPGHGAALPDEGAAHWLLSPAHGLGLIALAAVLWAVRHHRGRRS